MDSYDISGNYTGDSSALTAAAGVAIYSDSNGQNFIGYSDGAGNVVQSLAEVNTQLGNVTQAQAVGSAVANSGNGMNVLTTPTSGGSGNGLNSALLNAISSVTSAVSRVVSPPPKTSFNLGASGLSVSSAGSLFSNPLMLILLAVIAFLTWKAVSK